MAGLHDEVVGRRAEEREDHLGDVDAKPPPAIVGARLGDVDGGACELAVPEAGARIADGRIVRRAVQGHPGITSEISCLDRTRHHAQIDLAGAIVEVDLGATDPR